LICPFPGFAQFLQNLFSYELSVKFLNPHNFSPFGASNIPFTTTYYKCITNCNDTLLIFTYFLLILIIHQGQYVLTWYAVICIGCVSLFCVFLQASFLCHG